MINILQKNQINEMLRKSVQEISISKTQHETLVASYEAVGNYLAANEELRRFRPEIYPQGSIRLETAIKPISDDDDIDIDLVCEFSNIPSDWTQKDLKDAVGKCLKDSARYRDMIEKKDGGKRCWTLLYRQGSANNYHMDILPAVVADNYGLLLESFNHTDYSSLAISITDKTLPNYATSTNHAYWPHSNPFGYAKWFEQRCRQRILKAVCESVEEAPKYDASPSVLQDAIKLLKRNRDLKYGGDDDKPISIIITTLAARAYNGEANLYDALVGIASGMSAFIEERMVNGRLVKYIANPVDENENYADKWVNEPRKEKMFFDWLESVRSTVLRLADDAQTGSKAGFEALCGKNVIQRVYESVGQETKQKREAGTLRMGATGLLGSVGTKVQGHTFHGK